MPTRIKFTPPPKPNRLGEVSPNNPFYDNHKLVEECNLPDGSGLLAYVKLQPGDIRYVSFRSVGHRLD